MKSAKSLILLTALSTCAPIVRAQVNGQVNTPTVISGQGSSLAMSITSPVTVDGINGRLVYDPGYLTNFQLAAGAGASGFSLATNEVTPGDLRFVLYKNPPDASLDLAQATLQFNFDVLAGIVGAASSSLSFDMEAAGRILPDPPNDVISIAVGGPGGTPAPMTVRFNAGTLAIMGVPDIYRAPLAQAVNAGQDVEFDVGASGLGMPFGYQWYDTNGQLGGQTGSLLALNAVQTAQAGPYHCEVTNQAGLSTSTDAILTVFDPPETNNASFLGDSVPGKMFTNQALYVGVTMVNTSKITWSSAQGYSLAVISDPDNLFGGVTRIGYYSPTFVVPANGGSFSFNPLLTAPANPGTYSAQLRMVEEGKEFFGDTATISVQVIDRPNEAFDARMFQ